MYPQGDIPQAYDLSASQRLSTDCCLPGQRLELPVGLGSDDLLHMGWPRHPAGMDWVAKEL